MTYLPILIALLIALLTLPPELAIGCLPMLFMPPLFTTSICPDYCSGDPTSTSLTFSGIVNLNCASCTAFNTTMIIPVPYLAISGQCVGTITSTTSAVPNNCQGVGSNALTVKFQDAGAGNTQILVILEIAHATLNTTFHEWQISLGPSPAPCSGLGLTISWLLTSFSGSKQCDASGSSITFVN